MRVHHVHCIHFSIAKQLSGKIQFVNDLIDGHIPSRQLLFKLIFDQTLIVFKLFIRFRCSVYVGILFEITNFDLLLKLYLRTCCLGTLLVNSWSCLQHRNNNAENNKNNYCFNLHCDIKEKRRKIHTHPPPPHTPQHINIKIIQYNS